MLTAHHVVAAAVIAVTVVAALAGGLAYRRGREPGRLVSNLLALAQTVLVAQVALGLLLLSDHRRASHRLHYLYGTLALAAVLSPWLYAPPDARRRLAWFAGATLVAAALAVRAYMTS
jgi:hypothetical protein